MRRRDRKAQRMEVRRKLGMRQPRPLIPITTQRWPRRLIANACFSCRVSFKRPPLDRDHVHTCPNCGGEAAEMGRFFKVPKRSNAEQWRKVERLWKAGYRFEGQRADPSFPERLKDVDAFIRDNPRHPYRLRAYWV